MNFGEQSLRLYAVTDRSWLGPMTLYQQVEAAIKGGATCIQLREKALDRQAFLAEAMEIGALCRRWAIPFIINDDVDLALLCGADGVHVGQGDMEAALARKKLGPGKILGISARTVDQARLAQDMGADYLGVGAVFPTGTKADAAVLPHDLLGEICRAVQIPVVAIGGITADNILELKGSGAAGVALVSAIFGSGDIEGACRRLRALAEEMVQACI